MAWFSSYSSAPNVTVSKDVSDERYFARRYTDTGWVLVVRAVTTTRKEYRGLTNAAADSAVAYCITQGATGITKSLTGGGSYTVGYTIAVEDSWATL